MDKRQIERAYTQKLIQGRSTSAPKSSKEILLKIQQLDPIDLSTIRTPSGGVSCFMTRSVEYDTDIPFGFSKIAEPNSGGIVEFESPTKRMIGFVFLSLSEYEHKYSLPLNKEHTLSKKDYKDLYDYLVEHVPINTPQILWKEGETSEFFVLKDITIQERAIGLNFGQQVAPFIPTESKLGFHQHYAGEGNGKPFVKIWTNDAYLRATDTEDNSTWPNKPFVKELYNDQEHNMKSVQDTIPLGDKNVAQRTLFIPRIITH